MAEKNWVFRIHGYNAAAHDQEAHKIVARRYVNGIPPGAPVSSTGVTFVSAVLMPDGVTTAVTYAVTV